MLDPQNLIQTYGTIGIVLTVFAESSFFPFLPGDSLLFTAGFLAGQGLLSLYAVYFGVLAAAVFGNMFAYAVGRKYGNSIFSRPDSLFLNPNHIEKTRLFFRKYGSSAIIIARFVPIVRTFIPIFAGIGKMKYSTFFIYNVFGAFVWATSLVIGGYYIGTLFPGLKSHLHTIAIVIIFVSLVPALLTFIKEKRLSKKPLV